ncbi:hypothetical protein WKW79_33780 [Variovorax robiniae]|uniref:Uncharacterized protein n=1 Tax=Variovorax robiniae TaxID=1836199 RepID=A0ABU8XIE1_9BURK
MKRNDGTPQWPIPDLAVTVHQLAPAQFTWKLVERQHGHPAKCIAEAAEQFTDYEQALDCGFVALERRRQ